MFYFLRPVFPKLSTSNFEHPLVSISILLFFFVCLVVVVLFFIVFLIYHFIFFFCMTKVFTENEKRNSETLLLEKEIVLRINFETLLF